MAWVDVIKPFQQARIENGLRQQNLLGWGWQADIVKSWKVLWNDYLLLQKNGQPAELPGRARRTKEVAPPQQRRNLI